MDSSFCQIFLDVFIGIATFCLLYPGHRAYYGFTDFYTFTDLYRDLVSPNLGLGLKVETWRHGDSEPSICKNGQPWVSDNNCSVIDLYCYAAVSYFSVG